MPKNNSYHPEAFAQVVAQRAADLSILNDQIVLMAQQLYNEQDNYHGYATDHADEKLAHLSKELHKLADSLTSLRQYTNYPAAP